MRSDFDRFLLRSQQIRSDRIRTILKHVWKTDEEKHYIVTLVETFEIRFIANNLYVRCTVSY